MASDEHNKDGQDDPIWHTTYYTLTNADGTPVKSFVDMFNSPTRTRMNADARAALNRPLHLSVRGWRLGPDNQHCRG